MFQVLENSLVAVLMTHDNSLAPQFTKMLGSEYNIKHVIEWITSQCIEHLGEETKNCFKKILNDIIHVMTSRKRQLHRPDTVEMRTSRWAIPIERTSTMVKHCRQIFSAAQRTVNGQ